MEIDNAVSLPLSASEARRLVDVLRVSGDVELLAVAERLDVKLLRIERLTAKIDELRGQMKGGAA